MTSGAPSTDCDRSAIATNAADFDPVQEHDLSLVEAELERSILVDSFADFVRAAWPHMEPTRPLLPSIAFDALTAALQAVGERRIRRLACSLPPGVAKSLIAAVAFPAWLALRSNGTARVMCGSYAWDFAVRDSRRCRDLMQSAWYRSLVGDAWSIRADANRETDFWTSSGGRRLIVSVGGKALGERCTTQIIDDALSGADTHSPAAKKEAARWLAEVLPSRLEDPENDSRVLIGQRLAIDDPLAGAIERGWSYLCLPAMLGEGDEPCELRDDAGALVWRDPRAVGEPLLELLSADALDKLKAELGSLAFSAQYLQRPASDENALVRRAWWSFYAGEHVPPTSPRPAGCDTERPAIAKPEHLRVVIAADLTFGAAKGDHAVAQAWGRDGGSFFLLEQWRERGAGLERSVAAIADMASRYPQAAVLVEKAANGAAVIETLRKQIGTVKPVNAIGPKLARIAAMTPTIESGSCHLPLGWPGLEQFVEECAGNSKWDDIPDCASYAIRELSQYDFEPCYGPLSGGFGASYDRHTGVWSPFGASFGDYSSYEPESKP